MSEVLTESIARMWGASCSEEVIQTVCDGCANGNLDFTEPDFCPIQVNYGWEGEDKHIMCDVPERGKTGLRVWCTEFVEKHAAKLRLEGDAE